MLLQVSVFRQLQLLNAALTAICDRLLCTCHSSGFSRAVVSACVSGMLVVLVRVQLSVLGAFMYKDLQASRHVSKFFKTSIHLAFSSHVGCDSVC